MPSYLLQKKSKDIDYLKFVKPYKESIRANAGLIAKEHGVEIEFMRKSGVKKRIHYFKKKIEQRDSHPFIVHIISVLETCNTFNP